MRVFFTGFLTLAALLPAASLQAQILPEWNVIAAKQEQLGDKHGLLTGAVEIEQGDTKLYADHVETFSNQSRLLATGNVVGPDPGQQPHRRRSRCLQRGRPSCGTFYGASGIASGPAAVARAVRSPAIDGWPQLPPGQETDVYFFGEEGRELGFRGNKRSPTAGSGTCVQPTPRWDLSAGTITLNVDHYTLLPQRGAQRQRGCRCSTRR